jgi:hypothetical protein
MSKLGWLICSAAATVIVAGVPAWAQCTLDQSALGRRLVADVLRHYGGVYSSDCGNTNAPRLRVAGDSLIVEQGTKRMTGRFIQTDRSFFGQSGAPEFEIALEGTVRDPRDPRPGGGLTFIVYGGKSGRYITLLGGPEVEAALGKSLLGRKYRSCDPVRTEITSAPPSPPAVAHAEDVAWKGGKLASLAPTIGTYQYDEVLDDARVRQAVEALLPEAERASLKNNLGVHAPIEFIEGHLVLSGNAPHRGGEENASMWININDGRVYVVLLQQGKWTLYANEARFGYLPLELRKAVADLSMGGPQQPPADVRWIHKP